MIDLSKTSGAHFSEMQESLITKHIMPTSTLFHYTSYQGLIGILKTRRFWLTHFKNLNDPFEIEHGKKLILKAIDAFIGENKKLAKELKRKILRMIEENYHAFMTSFCDSGNYLPAWRYYGKDGAGFSIGFKPSFFESVKETNEDSVFFFKVLYKESDFLDLVSTMFTKFKEVYPLEIELNHLKDRKEELLLALITNLITMMPIAKINEYEEEREWRKCLIRLYDPETDKWFPCNLPLDRLVIKTHSQTEFPPFVKKVNTTTLAIESTPQFNYADIETIYIGPRLDFLSAKLAIEKLLYEIAEEDVQHIRIKKSHKPYQ